MQFPKFGSRKFFAFWFSIFLLVSLPIIYFYIGIDVSVQLFVLGALASVTLGYNFANVLETKWNPLTKEKDDTFSE